jgi:RimJ/RimL family protein N-acetyltransferase
MTTIPFPVSGLRVGDLLLRPPTAADVPFIAPAFLDEAVGGEAGLPKLTDPEIRMFISEQLPEVRSTGRFLPLVVIEGDAIVGGTSLSNYDPFRDRVEVGYWLFPAGRGRGIATRVVRALAAHAFYVGLLRVEAVVRPANEPSIRVLERAGFTREGVLRSLLRHQGGRTDGILFSLLPGE